MNCTSRFENTFGPTIPARCDDFDFTLLFEQSILQLAPSALLLLFTPVRLIHLHSQKAKVLRTGTFVPKRLAILCLACTQLALLVLWSLTPASRTRVSIPAAVVSFVASAALLYLSSVEHTRTVRPSTLINSYLLFSSILDIPQARTLWLQSGPKALAALFTFGLGAKTVVLVLEARSKRSYLYEQYRHYGPEALVGLYDRTVLLWLNPILWHGYKSFFTFEQLYSLDEDLMPENVDRAFKTAWQRYARFKKHIIIWATFRTVWSTLISLLLPRICLSALKLTQPLLINRITSLLGEVPNRQNTTLGKGLIGATALVYVGIAITTASYQRQLHRLIIQIRGCLFASIYRKVLVTQSAELADNAALTLVSADINRISTGLKEIHGLIATPIEVAVAVFLLQSQVGVACIAPVVLALVISGLSFINAGNAVSLQKSWLAAVSRRISYISVALQNPKGFKMLGLTDFFASKIQELRVEELAKYAHFRRYRALRNGVGTIPQAFAPAATLLMFTLIHGSQALTPSRAFTSLALVALLTSPIEELIHAIPSFQTALASLDRVQSFLTNKAEDLEMQHNFEAASTARNSSVELPSIPAMPPCPTNLASCTCAMDDVSVTLNGSQILQNVHLQLLSGTLNLLIGQVGSGKSTLLRTIIGDIKPTTGSIRTTVGCFSYCSQDVWLPNGSLRSLIIGASDYDAQWYRTVLTACALIQDMEAFPAGDDTLIGTRGISLSGGQRQRLTLARAIYARNPMLVADDVLSGLDTVTSRHVFTNVFGTNGLCKRNGFTAILATNSQNYFSQAESVVILDEHGAAKQVVPQEISGSEIVMPEVSLDRKANAAATPIDTDNTQASAPKLLQEMQQDFSRKTGSIAVYGYYVKSVGWAFGLLLLVTVVGFAFGMKFQDLWVRWWSESEVSGRDTKPLALWLTIIFLLATIAVVSIGAHVWVMLVNAVTQSSAQMHKQILDVCMRASYSFFVTTDTGVTLNRFSNDMSLIEEDLATAVMQVLNGAAFCIASILLIVMGADYAAATIPLLLLALYGIQRFYLRTSRQLRLLEIESQAPLLTHFSETISGISTIRAFGWQSYCNRKCMELLDHAQRPYYLLLCVQRWLSLVLQLVTGATAVIIVALAVSLRSTSSSGAIGASMLNILGFGWVLNHFVNAWTTLETSLGAVARCRNFERDTPQEEKAGEDHASPRSWPEAGALTFTHVNASYVVGGEDVLKDISLSVKAGEKIGICGRTGSGKSSLLLALLRLLDSRVGSITLDGVDLAQVPRQTLRERIIALPQETVVLPGSVRVNMDPHARCTDEQIKAALQKVGMLEIITQRGALEMDLKSLSLSHGQMQLLAVAGALLRKSKILVVDEISSSTDSETEEIMMRLIRQESQGSTVLAIAHRLRMLVDFDRVVVMDGGRIVEVGTPSELLANADGVFRSMWDAGLGS